MEFANQLIEFEYNHVIAGQFNDAPQPEVAAWRWSRRQELQSDLEACPE